MFVGSDQILSGIKVDVGKTRNEYMNGTNHYSWDSKFSVDIDTPFGNV